jgi:hypothetical protein
MYGRTVSKGRETLKKFHKVIRKLKKEKILKNTGSCCGSCASYEAATHLDEKEEFKDFLGYMTFNVQSRDSARECGEIWIGYGPRNLTSPWKKMSGKAEEFRVAAREQGGTLVGFVLKNFFEKHGFEVDWDGDYGHRIKLTLPEAE